MLSHMSIGLDFRHLHVAVWFIARVFWSVMCLFKLMRPIGVLVRCMCRGLARGLPFVARAALLACVGGLAFVVCVCLLWFPALAPACFCIPNYPVSL